MRNSLLSLSVDRWVRCVLFQCALVNAVASPVWGQDQCSNVLMPTTSRLEANIRLALDTVNYLDQGSAEDRRSTNNVSLLVPVEGGPPLDVGFNFGSSTAGYQYLRRYNSYSVEKSESFVNVVRHVTEDKVVEWGKCMANRAEFYVFVDPTSITSDSAILKVGNFRRGGAHQGTLSLKAQDALVEGNPIHNVELKEIGEWPFQITRYAAKKAVITASFGGYSPTVTIAPDALPLKTPKITYRVNGNLQEARVVNQEKNLPDFDVSVGVKFDSDSIQLTIEQLVDGKVCASRTISSQAMGDMMDFRPEWQNFGMRVGCQANGSPIATAVRCWVDPVFPGSCS